MGLHCISNKTIVAFSLVETGIMHEADDACSFRSTRSCYWLDQLLTLAHSTGILSKFSMSRVYYICFSSFTVFDGCEGFLCLATALS